MKQFMRSLFGRSEASDNRMVVGTKADVDLKEVAFIKNSKERLTELQQLWISYKGTPHETKLKAAYEKTEKIHQYLVSKKRGHELEIFHLQNTENFINTFTIILEVHQKQREKIFSARNRPAKAGSLPEKINPFRNKQNQETYRQTEMVRPLPPPEPFATPDKLALPVPQLSVPSISLNTFAKVLYYKEDASGNLIFREIGYTSTDLEKEGFLQYVSACLGIKAIAYMGNALVSIPNDNGSQPTGFVPVIYWEGFLYALNLNDFRLFPVRISRK